VASIERRLRALESTADVPDPEEREEWVRREVLRRMTDDELRRYIEVLEAAEERGKSGDEGCAKWREEDLPIFRRVDELEAEVVAEVSDHPLSDRLPHE
jgi:hypothetical protein